MGEQPGDLPVLERLADLERLVTERPGLFLRYSGGPAADASRTSTDFESGSELPGLSVTVLDPQPWWRRPLADWLARQVCKYGHLADEGDGKGAWVLAGTVVWQGPDHEPLVTGVQPVAWLGEELREEARRRYHDRFEVGRRTP